MNQRQYSPWVDDVGGAESLVSGFLPLRDEVSIHDFVGDAVVVQLLGDVVVGVVHVIHVPGLLPIYLPF